MTPTPELSALLRSWIPHGSLRTIARAAGVKASTLRDQYWGSSRPTPETFLAVGKAQARPGAEVSLAVSLACGDEHAAGWWRSVLGAPTGPAEIGALLASISHEAADDWAAGRALRLRAVGVEHG